MIKVINRPEISIKCDSCGATCTGDLDNFIPQNTMPPTWRVKCGFCNCYVICSPSALIAIDVGHDY